MFIVMLENGTRLREGIEVQNWNEIPIDASILAVTLWDENKLAFTLSGYDYWVVAYHAKTSQEHGMSIESQTLYTIQDQEVISISDNQNNLGFTVKQFPQSQFRQAEKVLRQGVPETKKQIALDWEPNLEKKHG